MAGHDLVYGQTILPPRQANEALEDAEAVRQRIGQDGYLLIRGSHEWDSVRIEALSLF